MKNFVRGLCGLVAAVVLIGILWYFRPFTEEVPEAVSIAQIEKGGKLKYCGTVTDESDIYVGLDKYKDNQYIYYFDRESGLVNGVECLTEPSSEVVISQNDIKNQSMEYINTVLGEYMNDTVIWEESHDNGLYEIKMNEFKNGMVTGTTAYCVYNNAGNLIAATFSVSKTAERPSEEIISKEYVYGIFMSYLAQEYEGEGFLADLDIEDCEITETTIGGNPCWRVFYYAAKDGKLLTLSDGRTFSGYDMLVNAYTGEIIDASQTKYGSDNTTVTSSNIIGNGSLVIR